LSGLFASAAQFRLWQRRLTAAVVELDVKQLSASHVNLDTAVGLSLSGRGDDRWKSDDRGCPDASSNVALSPAFNTDGSYGADANTDSVRPEANHRAGRNVAAEQLNMGRAVARWRLEAQREALINS
jgi:hypothetical protein